MLRPLQGHGLVRVGGVFFVFCRDFSSSSGRAPALARARTGVGWSGFFVIFRDFWSSSGHAPALARARTGVGWSVFFVIFRDFWSRFEQFWSRSGPCKGTEVGPRVR